MLIADFLFTESLVFNYKVHVAWSTCKLPGFVRYELGRIDEVYREWKSSWIKAWNLNTYSHWARVLCYKSFSPSSTQPLNFPKLTLFTNKRSICYRSFGKSSTHSLTLPHAYQKKIYNIEQPILQTLSASHRPIRWLFPMSKDDI